jgi:ABC-type multidrug transport system ATPase subunit
MFVSLFQSMDETEALCSNIGIMVNGELKCLGSLQHLKSKYGEGYTLMVKIALQESEGGIQQRDQNVNNFIAFVFKEFGQESVRTKENRDGFVNLHVNDTSTTCLSRLFSLVEANKQRFAIEFYVVTQTKLEQIFLNFASKQIDPETRLVSTSLRKVKKETTRF